MTKCLLPFRNLNYEDRFKQAALKRTFQKQFQSQIYSPLAYFMAVKMIPCNIIHSDEFRRFVIFLN